MSVSLNPSGQLGFQRPLTQLVKRTLAVSNSNSQPVAFKVKTTAPKQYCVRPNSGRIEPGETVEVQVLLQPMKEDPAPGTKCRDKFLVQSVIISTERETNSLAELWSAVEKEDKAGASLIHEQKIRCTYLAPSEEAAPGSGSPTVNGSSPTAGHDESKFATIRPANGGSREAIDTSSNPLNNSTYSPSPSSPSAAVGESPTPSYSVPSSISATTEKVIAGTGAAVAAGAAAVGLTSVASAVDDRTATAKANIASESSAPTTSSTPPPTSPAPKEVGSGDSLESQLKSAKAEIARLQAQLSQAETTAATLRSRGGAASGVSSGGAEPGTAQAVVQEKSAGGVPLEVVAGLVFGTFVITWLFF